MRTEVLLAGNVMRPVAGDPGKTEFTTIAHINPGGAADTPLGSQLANKICTYGPVDFIRKIESICGACAADGRASVRACGRAGGRPGGWACACVCERISLRACDSKVHLR